MSIFMCVYLHIPIFKFGFHCSHAFGPQQIPHLGRLRTDTLLCTRLRRDEDCLDTAHMVGL